jgi:hypothetical protein
MRKSNENSLKEVIDQLLEQYKLRDRLHEVRIRQSWETIMGQAINKRTNNIRVKDNTLLINVTSAPLREELQYQKSKILDMMNKELGGEFLKVVIIQ